MCEIKALFTPMRLTYSYVIYNFIGGNALNDLKKNYNFS